QGGTGAQWTGWGRRTRPPRGPSGCGCRRRLSGSRRGVRPSTVVCLPGRERPLWAVSLLWRSLMKLGALMLVLGVRVPGTGLSQPPACFPLGPSRGPLPVDVEVAQVRTDGALVWILLAYHNPTATPLHLGLHQWANACTQL